MSTRVVDSIADVEVRDDLGSVEGVGESATDAEPTEPLATVVFLGDDRDAARPMRDAALHRAGAWMVHFVEDVMDAVVLVRELRNVDAVVAHARPDGPAVDDFLDRVRRRSPHTARIVISDESDGDLLLRLNQLAHRVLPVRLEVESLVELIDQVRSATGTELGDPVRTLVGQIDRLPRLPGVFQRLTEIVESDDWSIGDLAEEITQDIALTGEILKLANSSFYGSAAPVTSVDRAIMRVGVDLIRFVVLGSKLYESRDELATWIDLDPLAQRARTVALGARALAIRDRASLDTSSLAYLAGLVSEIGWLVLGRVPDIADVIARPLNGKLYLGAERAIFGGDRFQVGAQLLGLWGFDQPVIDAVGHLSTEQIPTEGGLTWYLAAAKQLIGERGFDPHELAGRPGTNPELDAAVQELCAQAEATAAG